MANNLNIDYVNRHLHISHWEGKVNSESTINTSEIIQQVKEEILQEGGGGDNIEINTDAIIRTTTPPSNTNLFWLDPSDNVLKYYTGASWDQADQDIKADWNGVDW